MQCNRYKVICDQHCSSMSFTAWSPFGAVNAIFRGPASHRTSTSILLKASELIIAALATIYPHCRQIEILTYFQRRRLPIADIPNSFNQDGQPITLFLRPFIWVTRSNADARQCIQARSQDCVVSQITRWRLAEIHHVCPRAWLGPNELASHMLEG